MNIWLIKLSFSQLIEKDFHVWDWSPLKLLILLCRPHKRQQRTGRGCVPQSPIFVPITFSGTGARMAHLVGLRLALFLFAFREGDFMSENRWRNISEMCRLVLENSVLSTWHGNHLFVLIEAEGWGRLLNTFFFFLFKSCPGEQLTCTWESCHCMSHSDPRLHEKLIWSWFCWSMYRMKEVLELFSAHLVATQLRHFV